MFQVALDWNCVISLEEGRPYAPHIRQLQAWHNQGKIALCMSSPSRLENPRSPDRTSISEEEWEAKMRDVGFVGCQVPEKLNIKIRTNKGRLAGHDLGHSDQATAAVTPHEAGTDYKNCSSALLPAETLQACDKTCVRLQRA